MSINARVILIAITLTACGSQTSARFITSPGGSGDTADDDGEIEDPAGSPVLPAPENPSDPAGPFSPAVEAALDQSTDIGLNFIENGEMNDPTRSDIRIEGWSGTGAHKFEENGDRVMGLISRLVSYGGDTATNCEDCIGGERPGHSQQEGIREFEVGGCMLLSFEKQHVETDVFGFVRLYDYATTGATHGVRNIGSLPRYEEYGTKQLDDSNFQDATLAVKVTPLANREGWLQVRALFITRDNPLYVEVRQSGFYDTVDPTTYLDNMVLIPVACP